MRDTTSYSYLSVSGRKKFLNYLISEGHRGGCWLCVAGVNYRPHGVRRVPLRLAGVGSTTSLPPQRGPSEISLRRSNYFQTCSSCCSRLLCSSLVLSRACVLSEVEISWTHCHLRLFTDWHRPFHRGPPCPQSWLCVHSKSNANVGRECGGISRARGLPNALVEPDGLLRPRSGPRFASCIAHPGHLLGASGARRCGSAPWSLRMSSTRPRAPAAAATRAPRGLRASCLRTATERAPPLERQPSRACPPESAGVRAGA